MSIEKFLEIVGTSPDDFKFVTDKFVQMTDYAPKGSVVTVDLGNSIKYCEYQIIGSGFTLYLKSSKLLVRQNSLFHKEIIDIFKSRIPNLEIVIS